MVGNLTVGTVNLLQEAFFRAYCDLLQNRRKKAGVPNAFLREIASLNLNATFQDQDTEMKRDITTASSIILSHIYKMGFKLVPKD